MTPCLAAVLVGENPASQVYVRNKQKACEKAGIDSQLAPAIRPRRPTDELLALIDRLNRDPAVHGILVQLPLPKQIDETRVLEAVNPLKDVDAFHPENVGRIVQGRPRFLPCTPHGVQQLLLRQQHPDRRGQRGGAWAAATSSASRWRSCSCSAGRAATPR